MARTTTHRTHLLVALVVGALGLGLAGSAAVADDRQHPTDRRESARGLVGPAPEPVTATGAGGGCGMGVATATDAHTPPDGGAEDNPPSSTVTFTKRCAGPVIGTFTSEVSSGTSLVVLGRATCVATGGLARACVPGSVKWAEPGGRSPYFLDQDASAVESHSVTYSWPNLKPGRWRYAILTGGDATMVFRTLVVEAFPAA